MNATHKKTTIFHRSFSLYSLKLIKYSNVDMSFHFTLHKVLNFIRNRKQTEKKTGYKILILTGADCWCDFWFGTFI